MNTSPDSQSSDESNALKETVQWFNSLDMSDHNYLSTAKQVAACYVDFILSETRRLEEQSASMVMRDHRHYLLAFGVNENDVDAMLRDVIDDLASRVLAQEKAAASAEPQKKIDEIRKDVSGGMDERMPEGL